ncbi:hypothetical protein ABTK28_22300, partial [Acinetobacter baumannii]
MLVLLLSLSLFCFFFIYLTFPNNVCYESSESTVTLAVPSTTCRKYGTGFFDDISVGLAQKQPT